MRHYVGVDKYQEEGVLMHSYGRLF